MRAALSTLAYDSDHRPPNLHALGQQCAWVTVTTELSVKCVLAFSSAIMPCMSDPKVTQFRRWLQAHRAFVADRGRCSSSYYGYIILVSTVEHVGKLAVSQHITRDGLMMSLSVI